MNACSLSETERSILASFYQQEYGLGLKNRTEAKKERFNNFNTEGKNTEIPKTGSDESQHKN